jgi:oligopeptide transport system ATP-binding protein
MTAPLLDVQDLSVRFATPDGAVAAVSEMNFTLHKGECLGVVGESGSGKSQTFMAMMGLLASNGRATGKVLFNGTDLLTASRAQLNTIRGDRMAMIFQDPMTSLTPHMRIGDQLVEVLTEHKSLGKAQAKARALEMLEIVRIPDPERRFRQFPHEFSGGMRQRVMIAMALLCKPDLLIADEPTTALDVTVQAQILQTFRGLKEHTETSIILITHDLGVVAGLCDRVMVMYAGRPVEFGPAAQVFYDPQHPYTQALLQSMPRIDMPLGAELAAIGGQPPNLQNLPPGCAFAPRCAHREALCEERPILRSIGSGRMKACHREVQKHAVNA